jgi:sugar phosphate isomerase/epimerase
LKKEIELSAFLGAELLVVHVLNFGVVEAESKLEIDEEYFLKALGFARKCNVFLALENGFFQSLKRFCDIAGNSEYLKICLDVGHANNPNQSHLTENSLKTFIQEYGQRIIHLHFHDNHGKIDEHLVPGEGNIDWHEVMKELCAANIRLTGALELRGNISIASS